MLFNSWQFALFFPLVTAGYFALPPRWRWAWLLVASCVFYMAFVPLYLLILIFTIGVDYVAGLAIGRSEGPARKRWLLASLAANLGTLGFFKYFNFANENLTALAGLLHWNYSMQALAIVLPIGLSFHVFQSMSYTIEVYRGHQAPERHLGIFALYVMFYPQLVAGPIERPQNLLNQFHAPRPLDVGEAIAGLRLMGWGLFKKVVVADRLAIPVGLVFAHPHAYAGLPLVLAVLAFSIQIYCDFSGYSDLARGSAQVMGVRLMENFRQPYRSASLSEFWTRWHISLSTWFRDYLYIPLGGNRVPRPRWLANLFVVFFLSGLWHGAAWTFLAWGALHGGWMALGVATAGFRARAWALVPWGGLRRGLQVAATFCLVSFAWIFFRAGSLSDATYIASHLGTGLLHQLSSPRAMLDALAPVWGPGGLALAACVVAVTLVAEGRPEGPSRLAWFLARPRWVRWAGYYALVLALVFLGNYGGNTFIYFQF